MPEPCACQTLMESLAFYHQDICMELFTSQHRLCEDALREKKTPSRLTADPISSSEDNKDTHTHKKINAHCVKPCQLLLQALLSRFGTTGQTQKCKNETQLDCFIQRRKCLLLGRSSGWMVTPAAEHHSHVVIHAGCSDGGHPG